MPRRLRRFATGCGQEVSPAQPSAEPAASLPYRRSPIPSGCGLRDVHPQGFLRIFLQRSCIRARDLSHLQCDQDFPAARRIDPVVAEEHQKPAETGFVGLDERGRTAPVSGSYCLPALLALDEVDSQRAALGALLVAAAFFLSLLPILPAPDFHTIADQYYLLLIVFVSWTVVGLCSGIRVCLWLVSRQNLAA